MNDQEAFTATIRDSLAAAEKGLIVTFSVTPDFAHTGYGYIRPGANIGYGVQAIQEFIEKPEKSRAEKLLREGCMWNSGNFLFRAATMKAEIERFEPELARVARDAAATLLPYDDNSIQCDLIDAKIFSAAPLKSIDYAVLERTKSGLAKQLSMIGQILARGVALEGI